MRDLSYAYYPFELRNLADLFERHWFGETVLLRDEATRERYAQKLEEIAASLKPATQTVKMSSVTMDGQSISLQQS